MKMKRIACVCVVVFTIFVSPSSNAKQQERPKLVLEIVVDQLRGWDRALLDELDLQEGESITARGTGYGIIRLGRRAQVFRRRKRVAARDIIMW